MNPGRIVQLYEKICQSIKLKEDSFVPTYLDSLANLTPSQNGPGPTWPRPNLTPFGPIWLHCLRVKMGLAQLDPGPTRLLFAKFNPTLSFFLAVQLVWLCQGVNSSSTFWLFQGVNNRNPSWPLARFDPAVFSSSFSLLVWLCQAIKNRSLSWPLTHFDCLPIWPCCLFLSCCSLSIWLCQGVNSSSPHFDFFRGVNHRTHLDCWPLLDPAVCFFLAVHYLFDSVRGVNSSSPHFDSFRG